MDSTIPLKGSEQRHPDVGATGGCRNQGDLSRLVILRAKLQLASSDMCRTSALWVSSIADPLTSQDHSEGTSPRIKLGRPQLMAVRSRKLPKGQSKRQASCWFLPRMRLAAGNHMVIHIRMDITILDAFPYIDQKDLDLRFGPTQHEERFIRPPGKRL